VTGKTRLEITESYNNKQHLIKRPFVKPYESTYVANRPISDPTARALDTLKPRSRQKTTFFKEGEQLNI
jgi:hypothetical protein